MIFKGNKVRKGQAETGVRSCLCREIRLKEIYQRKDYLQAAHFFQLYIRAVSWAYPRYARV